MNGVWRWLLAAVLVLTAAACSSDGDAAEVSGATVPTEATTSTTLSVEQEVERAYLKSWDVYAEAVRYLKKTDLAGIFGGEYLATVTSEIDERAAERRPSRVEVEHDYRITVESRDRATVVDSYRNHSVQLDPTTGEPVEPDPNELLVETYTMERIGGQWKVVRVTRER